MHTYDYSDEEIRVHIHHNSDLSGNVIIDAYNGLDVKEVMIPGDAILEFVLQYMTRVEIAKLEQMTMHDALEWYTGSSDR